MIIDYHAHIWRYENPEFAEPNTECTAEWLIRAMDRAKVDRSVIVPLVYVPSAKAKRVLNDNHYILKSIKKVREKK